MFAFLGQFAKLGNFDIYVTQQIVEAKYKNCVDRPQYEFILYLSRGWPSSNLNKSVVGKTL